MIARHSGGIIRRSGKRDPRASMRQTQLSISFKAQGQGAAMLQFKATDGAGWRRLGHGLLAAKGMVFRLLVAHDGLSNTRCTNKRNKQKEQTNSCGIERIITLQPFAVQ